MKEKVSLKNDIKIKDKQAQENSIRFLDVLKAFWSPEVEETSEVETIMNDQELSNETKKLLIKSLKNADKIIKPTDGGISRKTTNLRVEAKESAEKALKQNPIHVNKVNRDTKKQAEKSLEDD